MSEFTYETGDDYSDSSYLSTPGWFHLVITNFEYPALDQNGQIMDWALFRVTCEVLASDPEGLDGKPVSLTVSAPKPSARDGGKFQRKVADRFLLATSVVDPSQKNAKVSIDPERMTGRQFITRLKLAEKEGKVTTYLEFAGSEIYHVDDPAVKSAPRSSQAIDMIPSSLRRESAKTTHEAATTAPKEAAPVASSVDDVVGDL